MIRCIKCKTKIYSHLWVVRGWDNQERVYCSPNCERGGKSQFEATLRALRSR